MTVQPYRGYGTPHQILLYARVLEDAGLPAPTPRDSKWTNFKRMWQMLETDEVPRARVRVSVGGREQFAEADEEGYVAVTFDATADDAGPGSAFAAGVHEVVWQLLAPLADGQGETVVRGEAYVPRADAGWIVVSDVDDTVMHTGATSLAKMAANTLLANAYGRVAFPGVGAFYRALHRPAADGHGHGRNPVFYLTSSMWSLYDVLKVFFDVNGLPPGPILMRDLGIDKNLFIKGTHEAHKLGKVRELMALYEGRRFILIGDTGQHDAEIYREVCRESPDRILAVYLRDVSTGRRDEEVKAIVAEIRRLGVECVAAEQTVAHAEHAHAHAWIDADSLAAVGGDARRDVAAGAG